MSGARPESRSGLSGALAIGAMALGGAAVARAFARSRRRYGLRGRVALVTGGSRGLGLVLARELAREGAKVAICARDEAELARARDGLRAAGADVVTLPCDVRVREGVEAMLDELRERLGPVDMLINNAGVIQVGPAEEMTLDDYEEALRVHFWGPLYVTHGVLPDMRRRGEGRIVNITSIGGKISVPHLLPYCASKFALVGFSEGLRGALAKDGIYVTTVCPGLMRTGSPRNAWFKGQHREEYAWFSISDAMPLVSMAAGRAARRILEACRDGDAELVMPVNTLLAVKLNALFPGAGAGLLSAAERLLPGPGGIGPWMKRGAESESTWAPSVLTTLGDRAARRNNEVQAEPV